MSGLWTIESVVESHGPRDSFEPSIVQIGHWKRPSSESITKRKSRPVVGGKLSRAARSLDTSRRGTHTKSRTREFIKLGKAEKKEDSAWHPARGSGRSTFATRRSPTSRRRTRASSTRSERPRVCVRERSFHAPKIRERQGGSGKHDDPGHHSANEESRDDTKYASFPFWGGGAGCSYAMYLREEITAFFFEPATRARETWTFPDARASARRSVREAGGAAHAPHGARRARHFEAAHDSNSDVERGRAREREKRERREKREKDLESPRKRTRPSLAVACTWGRAGCGSCGDRRELGF